jgi:hypothetical protein
LVHRAQDRFQHANRVLHHLVVPESQNQVTHRFQRRSSVAVPFSLLVMLTAVDFDDELRLGADEIDDVSVDRDLPLEFPTGEAAVTQAKPQQALGVGLSST